jgi:phosphatidylinositol glycan class A protein
VFTGNLTLIVNRAYCRAFISSDVVRALSIAIETVVSGAHDPYLAHRRLKGMYTWANVAERTERVYAKALSRPERDMFERMSR